MSKTEIKRLVIQDPLGAAEKIFALESELAALRVASKCAECERLREALEFYADPQDWYGYEGGCRKAIHIDDCDVNGVGGKRARAALSAPTVPSAQDGES